MVSQTKALLKKLNVFMNNIKVGTLAKDKGQLSFSYDSSWLSHSASRPLSLSLPLSTKPYYGDVVYHFFDNLLPDNLDLRKKIQTMFHTTSDHVFDLLTNIGKDCIGAIQLLATEPLLKQVKIEGKKLTTQQMEQQLKNYQVLPLGMSEKNLDFRISLAGAQEKSAFLKYKNSWYQPVGTTPTSHIFKLPIGYISHQDIDLSDSCENEWLCLKILAAFGVKVANADINYFNSAKVLVVERFDRAWSKDKSHLLRLPQEDCCQALGLSSNLKYQADGGPGIQSIMDLLLGSVNAEQDRYNFFKVQVIFFLLAAIDGHAKNFSIFLQKDGEFLLTPIYDVISAHPMMYKKQLQSKKIKMAMALIGKNKHYTWYNIYRRHFISTAKQVKFSIKQAHHILDEVTEQVELVISQVEKLIPSNFPSYISTAIFNGMRQAAQKLKL